MAECGKGWTGRCSAAKSKKCKCRCGGANHGTAREPEKVKPAPGADDLIVEVVGGGLVGRHSVEVIPWFQYPGLHDSRPGACHIAKMGRVIVATERDDNPGASVTNCAEKLYAELQKRYGEDVVVVEHYANRGYGIKEHLSLVNIVDGHPRWTHLNREDLKILIQEQKPRVREAVSYASVARLSDDELVKELTTPPGTTEQVAAWEASVRANPPKRVTDFS